MTITDPAPSDEADQLYECLLCGARRWSDESIIVCPDCEGAVQNLSRPRPE
jgi:DNA-directed RNA polymerase subunit RPC12/RpoP